MCAMSEDEKSVAEYEEQIKHLREKSQATIKKQKELDAAYKEANDKICKRANELLNLINELEIKKDTLKRQIWYREHPN